MPMLDADRLTRPLGSARPRSSHRREYDRDRDEHREQSPENVEAEVMGVCQMDALDAFGETKVFEVDTTELSAPETAEKIDKVMKDSPTPVRIDWMAMLEEEGRLDEFLSD